MKLVVGSDHAGFPMKAELLAFLKQDRPVSAAKRYADATHVDLSLASRVIDALEQGNR